MLLAVFDYEKIMMVWYKLFKLPTYSISLMIISKRKHLDENGIIYILFHYARNRIYIDFVSYYNFN